MKFTTSLRLLYFLSALLLFALVPAGASQTVPHYLIEVRVNPTESSLNATVTVLFPAAPVGTEHGLLLARTFTVKSATAKNATVTVADSDTPLPNLHRVAVRTTAEEGVEVTLTYAGPLGAWVEPPMNTISPALIELNVDSFWLPYQEVLASPFTIAGNLRGLPENAEVVSTNPFTRTTDGIRLEGDDEVWDLALIASPEMHAVTAGRFSFRAVDLESPTAMFYREHGVRAMTYLEERFGPSARSSVAITVVRRANGSGYSRPGYVVVTEGESLKNPSGVAKFIAHELSHGWFSRANPRSEDYWLTEAPAEYVGLCYAESVFGPEALAKTMENKRALAAKAGSLLGRGRAPDGELYSKGPVLLFDLETKIGRDAVHRVLAAFAADTRHHTTPRFLELLTKEAGDEVAAAFAQSLH